MAACINMQKASQTFRSKLMSKKNLPSQALGINGQRSTDLHGSCVKYRDRNVSKMKNWHTEAERKSTAKQTPVSRGDFAAALCTSFVNTTHVCHKVRPTDNFGERTTPLFYRHWSAECSKPKTPSSFASTARACGRCKF